MSKNAEEQIAPTEFGGKSGTTERKQKARKTRDLSEESEEELGTGEAQKSEEEEFGATHEARVPSPKEPTSLPEYKQKVKNVQAWLNSFTEPRVHFLDLRRQDAEQGDEVFDKLFRSVRDIEYDGPVYPLTSAELDFLRNVDATRGLKIATVMTFLEEYFARYNTRIGYAFKMLAPISMTLTLGFFFRWLRPGIGLTGIKHCVDDIENDVKHPLHEHTGVLRALLPGTKVTLPGEAEEIDFGEWDRYFAHEKQVSPLRTRQTATRLSSAVDVRRAARPSNIKIDRHDLGIIRSLQEMAIAKSDYLDSMDTITDALRQFDLNPPRILTRLLTQMEARQTSLLRQCHSQPLVKELTGVLRQRDEELVHELLSNYS